MNLFWEFGCICLDYWSYVKMLWNMSWKFNYFLLGFKFLYNLNNFLEIVMFCVGLEVKNIDWGGRMREFLF